MERTNNLQRSELWQQVHAIVKQIPIRQVEGDAMDAASASSNIEELFLKKLHKPIVMESLLPGTTGYLVYHNDKVNSILGAALMCLSIEQLCALRDSLIERTTSNEGSNAP